MSLSAQWTPETLMETGAFDTQTFGTSDYRGHAQNWAIAQDTSGILYVGNGSGLLEYDGVSWRQLSVPGNAAVRSLALGPDGRMYVGSNGEFGYLAPDSTGTMEYVSMVDQVPEDDREFNYIWRIVSTSDAVYFSARERLFRWSEKEGLRSWAPETMYALGFAFEDTFHTVEPGRGLLRAEGDSLQMAPEGEAFANDIIYYALPLEDGSALLGTREQVLMQYDGTSVSSFATEVDKDLDEARLYHGAVLDDGTLAITTHSGGVFLLDQEGRLLRSLDDSSDAKPQQAWYAYTDHDGGLWLALNNGLARLDTSSSLSFLNTSSGLHGMINGIVRYNGELYAASSVGIFRMVTAPGTTPSFEPVTDDATGQCLHATKADSGALMGCEQGIFQINENGVTRLTSHTVRLLHVSENDPGVLYAGAQEGLLRLVQTEDSWTLEGPVEGMPGWVLSLHEEPGGSLWASTVSDGVVRADVENGVASNITRYQMEDGLPEGWTYVRGIDDRVVVHSQKGIFAYEPGSDDGSFVPDTEIGGRLADPEGSVFLFEEDAEGALWFDNNREVNVLPRTDDGSFAPTPERIAHFPDVSLSGILTETERGAIWFGTEEGIVRHAVSGGKRQSSPLAAQIRRVSTIDGDSLLRGGMPSAVESLELPYEKNGLRFSFALPAFGGNGNEYQTYLEGFDRGWSSWTEETVKDYTNLPPGTYVFHVRGRDATAQDSTVGSIAFQVLPPWYRTWWAYLLFGVAFLGLIGIVTYAIMRYRVSRLRAQNRDLEERVQQRTRTLERANDRLRRAVDQNNEFLSIAAHELKNPLNSIVGFSEIIVDEDLPKEQAQEYLEIIQENVWSMNATIEALQQTDAIEQGRLELHLTRSELVEMVRSVVRRNEAQAAKKSIDLHVEHDGPVFAEVDQQYMPRVLDNLISNAIKFSPRDKGVWVSVEQRGRHVVLSVQDEGPGMSEEDMQRAFQKLQRLSARPTAGEGSTGLGLYIVHNIVDLHGGEVEIESKLGEGTTFTVTVPAVTVSEVAVEG